MATSLHHVALTVSDFDVSIPWYENVFGIKFQMDAPHDGGVGKLLADEAWSLVLVLHVHEASKGENFDERRTGLDHVGIAIPSEADLLAFQTHLEEVGGVQRVDVADRPLTQSPIADTPYGLILVFRDPDNIQLEAFAPPRG
jgi:glyoxylase I family protein